MISLKNYGPVPPAAKSEDIYYTAQGQDILFCWRRMFESEYHLAIANRECQKHDFKSGQPPHKQMCGKPLRDLPFALCTESVEANPFPLYTSSPSPALLTQVHFPVRDQQYDYVFLRKDGNIYGQRFHGEYRKIFLELRKEAMESRNLASVSLMEWMLRVAVQEDKGWYQAGDFVPQLEREYETNINECRAAAAGSTKHMDLLSRMRKAPLTSASLIISVCIYLMKQHKNATVS